MRLKLLSAGGARRFVVLAGLVAAMLACSTPAFAAVPPNDQFADAIRLGGEAGVVTGDTSEATMETGENCAPDGASGPVGCGPSVWYKYVSPAAEPQYVTFSLCGSGYDTVLSAWRGETLETLFLEASNDDSVECGIASVVRFQALPGLVYWIRVSSHGDAGLYQLHHPAGSTGSSNYYRDFDSDGYGAGEALVRESPLSGWVTRDGDCNDAATSVNPGATEILNQVDDDCDGSVDEGLIAYYKDGDGDTYGAGTAVYGDVQPSGHVTRDGDCDDNVADVHPGADEAFNQRDDDCDGVADEGLSTIPATLVYSGPAKVSTSGKAPAIKLSAQLSSAASVCANGRWVTFTVSGSAGGGGHETAISDGTGLARVSMPVTGWPSGTYTVTVMAPITTQCAHAQDIGTFTIGASKRK